MIFMQGSAMRRAGQVMVLAAGLALTGCSSLERSIYGDYAKVVRTAWSEQFGDGGVTREQAAAIPYASMGFRFNGSRESLLVLATDTGGNQLWTSASHIVLVTRNGRIQQSVGLPLNLAGTTAKVETIAPAQAKKAPFTSTRQQDFPDLGLYSVTLQCQATAMGPAKIMILGSTMTTIRVDERCQAQGLDWSFVDSFWVDPESAFTWKSVQHIHPKGATLNTEIFRAPS